MDLKGIYEGIRDWWVSLDDETRLRELRGYAVRRAYNSARIEDDTVTMAVTKEICTTGQLVNYTGPLSTINAIQGQRDAFARVLGDVERHRPFDESLVLEAHQALTWGTYSATQLADGERPGTYRVGDYLIPKASEVGAAAEDVPRLVGELTDEIAEALATVTPKKALVVAAYFHTSFEAIHPFADGSGLVGRLLMNYVLLCAGHPPVVLFDEDKRAYFDALEAFDTTGDLEPFKKFLMAEVIKTWRDSAKA